MTRPSAPSSRYRMSASVSHCFESFPHHVISKPTPLVYNGSPVCQYHEVHAAQNIPSLGHRIVLISGIKPSRRVVCSRMYNTPMESDSPLRIRPHLPDFICRSAFCPPPHRCVSHPFTGLLFPLRVVSYRLMRSAAPTSLYGQAGGLYLLTCLGGFGINVFERVLVSNCTNGSNS